MTIRRRVSLVLSAVPLLLVVVVAVLAIGVPKLSGATPLAILTGSMEPALPPGTLIVVRPVDAQELAVGDIVTYQIQSGEPDLITHRIVGVTSSTSGDVSYILKGDNNSDADAAPVVAEQVRGRFWYALPFLGFVSTAVSGEARSWIAPAAALLLLGYAAYALADGTVSMVRDRADRRRRVREVVDESATM